MNIFSLWTRNSYHTLVIRIPDGVFTADPECGHVVLDPGLSCEEEQYHGRRGYIAD